MIRLYIYKKNSMPDILSINNVIHLELSAEKHAAALFNVIDNNREHLSAFLPWVGAMHHADNMAQYFKNCVALIEDKKEMSFVIFYNNEPVGRIGLHYINMPNKTAAIGYWLSKNAQGHGIILQCCKKIIELGFNELGLHRLELKAAVKNTRSLAVPAKLNFKQEGIMREAEFVNGEYVDLVLFSLLRHEWNV